MPGWNPKANDIFLEALEHPAEQRRNYLDQACNRADLRAEVEALLAADDKAADFLANPPSAIAFESREGAELFPPISEGSGSRIGPYKLLEQVGEGGMGVVFVAEQTEPVRRRVAIKIIKPGMDTKQVIARFEAERQALAMMDHPHIARVLEAGATEAGRPYFVMELVRGLPITEYCDKAKLDPRKRLELFINVCQAVQHAHQKGIIHRDLKPSNVMITLHDGRPVVKVIDFGVAKAVGQQLTDRTVYTALTQLVGTPLYMSPEQAEMSGLDVDTRSDVYTLGVLLYELLTGQTPFDKETLGKAGLDEIRRIIREDEPLRPSRRLSTLGAAAISTVSQQRGLDERRLSQVLRGEVDWIVMRALEKDRERRYESAASFAADIERYLKDEPVQACPPSAWYRVRKFTRRHRVGLVVAVAVAAALLVAVGSLGWIVHDRQNRLDVTAQQVTETLDEVESLYKSGKLSEAVLAAKTAHGRLEAGGGGEGLRKRVQDWLADLEMVDKLEEIRFRWANIEVGFADEFHKAFRDYGIDVLSLPETESAARISARPIRLDLAGALDVWALGEDPALNKERRLKLTAITRLADPDPLRDRLRDVGIRKVKFEVGAEDIESQPQATLELLTSVLTTNEKRIAFLRKVHERYPDNFRVNLRLGRELETAKQYNEAVRFGTAAVALRPGSKLAHLNLGLALRNQGSANEAMASLRTAIRLDPKYVWAYNILGVALKDLGRVDDAIATHRESIRIQPDYAAGHLNLGIALFQKGLSEEGIAEFREAIRLRPKDALAHYSLGFALSDRGELDEAMACYREAIRLKPDYSAAHNNLGTVLDKKGLTDQALDAYREGARRDPQNPKAHYNLGAALRKKGEPEQAIESFREAIRINSSYTLAYSGMAAALHAIGKLEEAITAFRQAIRLQPEYAEAHGNLGVCLAHKLLDDEAIACYREALRLKPEDHHVHFNLGMSLITKGMLDEAAGAFREAHRLKHKTLGASHNSTRLALIHLHLAEGNQAIAEPLQRELLIAYEKNEPNTLHHYDAMSCLGATLSAQRKFDEAEPLLLGGYEGLMLQKTNPGTAVIEALQRLVQLYESSGQDDKANQWRKQLETHKQERAGSSQKS